MIYLDNLHSNFDFLNLISIKSVKFGYYKKSYKIIKNLVVVVNIKAGI